MVDIYCCFDSGQIIKLRNNLSEFSPTDSLSVLSNGDSGWLFSAGYDIDNGHGYINGKSNLITSLLFI